MNASSKTASALPRLLMGAVAVLLLAAALRMNGLGHTPFWSDEGWNLWAVQSDFQTDVARLAANHHPPAYFWTLDGWRALAGESKLALGFVAWAAGLLTVAVVLRAGADLGGLGVAVAAGLLLATQGQMVYYGQTIRHYSFLLLAAALSTWLLMRALRRPTWPRFAAYGAVVAFTAYSMYIGAFVVAAQAFTGLVLWRAPARNKLKLLAAYGLALVLFIPWLLVGLDGALNKINRGAITDYLNSLASTPQGVQAMLTLILGGQVALGLGAWALCLTGQRRPVVRVLPLMASAGALLLMVVVNLRLGVISERTLAMLFPAGGALAAAVGMTALPPLPRRLLIGLWAGWMALTAAGDLPRLNSHLAAQAIADGYSVGDMVLLETGFDDAAFGYQIERSLPAYGQRIFRSYYEYDYPDDPAMMAALDRALANTQRVWLVYWNVPPRMADKLSGLGFVRLERVRLPVGSGDPLYQRDPWMTVSLWARPQAFPNQPPVRYDAIGLTLEGVTLAPALPQGTDRLYLDSWWSPAVPIDRDYTVGAFLLNEAGQTVAESFAPPPDQPMRAWPVGGLSALRHRFELPPDLPAGEYSLRVVVYWYQTPDAPVLADGQPFVTVGHVLIHPTDTDAARRPTR